METENKKKFFKLPKLPLAFLGMFFLSVSFFATGSFWVEDQFVKYKALGGIQEGAQTCFSRVSQSFMARMIGQQNSAYTAPEFLSLSEECFGDTLTLFNEHFKKDSKTANAINKLASNVHWFHNKVKVKEGTPFTNKTVGEMDLDIISRRYEEIEIEKDKIWEKLENLKNPFQSNISLALRSFLIFGCALLGFGLIFSFGSFGFRRKQFARKSSDNEAAIINDDQPENFTESIENLSQEVETSTKREEMLDLPLAKEVEQSPLNFLEKESAAESELFNSDSEKKEFNLEEKSEDSFDLIAPQLETMEEAENVEESEESSLEEKYTSLNLGNCVAKTIDLFSSKIFSMGVRLEFEVEENNWIFGEKEQLDHILYQVLNNSLNSITTKDQSKKEIRFKSNIKGDNVRFEIWDTGAGFGDLVPESSNDEFETTELEESQLSSDLVICKELLKEIKGKLSFANSKGFNKTIIEFKIAPSQEIESQAGQGKKEIRQFFKGTKKDFLQSI